ncbi:uncharacterized protein TM35_000102360 [Trypanosoma theileri]|uniref:Uncharacterized protein n=1 Tax=Trypanosoma theileri TaxID=67003 RepID=A0A1X0NZJ8_9TRYP|nr:uncharacterized protein TM35_000102360 [Trypanosoma theileri]ORC89968.1 hypothetical protein TM35_000102360 [Trypanosoma theileri]
MPGEPVSGVLRYPDGAVYEGGVAAGAPAGRGACVFASGAVVVGNFVAGVAEGPAAVLLPGGVLFTGTLQHARAHGDGIYLTRNTLTRGRWVHGALQQHVAEPANRNTAAHLLAPMVELLGKQLTHLTQYAHKEAITVNTTATPCEPLVQLSEIDYYNSHKIYEEEEEEEKQDPQFSEKEQRGTCTVPTRAPSQGSTLGGGTPPPLFPTEPNGSFSYGTLRKRTVRVDSQHQEKGGIRNILVTGASPQAIFASAAPAANEFFSFQRFMKYCVLFLFPFLSVPQLPFSPIRSATLEMEREFVVSGAPLLRKLDPPVISLYIIAVAMCCHIAAIAIVAAKVDVSNVSNGHLTTTEMAIPCVLWVTHACICAGYNSYMRVAHALERLDRRLTPRLSAFAAGIVDTKTKVCIYTWDDEGRSMVTNRHYRYRWVGISVFIGILMGFAGPITRAGFGHPLFGNDKYERAGELLVFASVLLFSAALAYYVLKMIDMQRQILEQMRVLTRLAYLEDRSIMHPSESLHERFNFEEPLNTGDVFNGVTGWYVVRSIVLYAATCSNHAARSSAMSIYFLLVFCCFIVSIGDIIYMVASGNARNGRYYSVGHTYAIILCISWGVMLLRYMYICVRTGIERARHLYLLDVASLYHRLKPNLTDSSADIIGACSKMVKDHDQLPCIFSIQITPLFLACMVLIHMLALVVVVVDVYLAIHFR